MKNQEAFLQFIYTDDLYVIDEPETVEKENEVIQKPDSELENAANKINEAQSETLKETQVQEPDPVSFLGENQKYVLILVNSPNDKFINDSEKAFLMKIVESGLRFSLDDIAIANCSNYSPEQIMDEINAKFLITFGIDNITNHELYQIFQWNGKSTLLAEDLKSIEADVSKKTKLWKALKLMFNIN